VLGNEGGVRGRPVDYAIMIGYFLAILAVGSKVRLWATVFILVYLVGYVGVNLFTMGKVLSVFWRRYTRTAALWTRVGGMAAIVVSLFVPQIIAPFAHGLQRSDGEEGFWPGCGSSSSCGRFSGWG